MFQQNSDDDEVEVFTKKIKALNHVAEDLTEVIKRQNNRLKGISPEFNGSFAKLQSIIRRLTSSDNRKFRGWLYYPVATIVIVLLIFVLFIMF